MKKLIRAARSTTHRQPLSDETCKRRLPALRADLLDAQYALHESGGCALLILVNGFDGSGRDEIMPALNAWMDPRHIVSNAFQDSQGHHPGHPSLFRYWPALPAKGTVGIMAGNWYSSLAAASLAGKKSDGEFKDALQEIRRFESLLLQENIVVLKLWFYLSRSQQRSRLRAWSKDPAHAWQVTKEVWQRHRNYKDYARVGAAMIRANNQPAWHLLNGHFEKDCLFHAGALVLSALQHNLTQHRQQQTKSARPPSLPRIIAPNPLHKVDLSQVLPSEAYQQELPMLQGEIHGLLRKRKMRRRNIVLVFEGMDAAGKGGNVRRVASAMDPWRLSIVPVAAPSENELRYPYLWRFWQHIPAPGAGRAVIFDRSWYGRVLVERIEGFCSFADGERAYDEINEFEKSLSEEGIMVIKFYLVISPAEQLRRFEQRESSRFRRFKITPDDWRNRKKWPQYEKAVAAMIQRTDNKIAPWRLIAAENKQYGRVQVLRHLYHHLKDAA